MEKILSITAPDDLIVDDKGYLGHMYPQSCDGFVIETTEQVVQFGISNEQNCCEHWGTIMAPEDVSSFVGAQLLSMTLTDEALNTVKLPDLDSGGAVFLTLHTSNGPCQFVVYNEHNGYYGHKVWVRSRDLQHEGYV